MAMSLHGVELQVGDKVKILCVPASKFQTIQEGDLFTVSAIKGWQIMLTPEKNPKGAYGWVKCTHFEFVSRSTILVA